MENTRVKKIVILVAALLTLTIVGLQFGLTNFMQAFAEPNDDVKVEYSAQVNEEKSEAQIQISTTPKEQEVEITSIELPNGEIVNDTTATYKATENGKLTFTINYKLPKASSEQPFIDKEPEYEEKQQIATYQVTGIQPAAEQEAQTPAESSPESTTESNPSGANSSPQNTTESTPNSPPALQQPHLTNGALQQNNLGDPPTAYTPDNAFTFDEATGTITKYDKNIGGTDVTIPQTINGIPVKAIGVNAFQGKGLTSVSLPNGLQTIGNSAFSNNQLTEMPTLPPSITTIPDHLFAQNKITHITIPNNITAIGMYAFNNNLLTSINIPSNVTSIGERAFSLNQLTGALTLPEGLQIIGNYAFGWNYNITNVTIPSTVTSIGKGVFWYNAITELPTLPSAITTIPDQLFLGNNITNLTIPSSITAIGEEAFSDNKLTNVTIPSTVTSLGSSAFYNNQLTEMPTLPPSITTIPDHLFKHNKIMHITIPNNITAIGDSAFEWNQLTSVTIPSTVISLGNSAFADNKLTGIQLQEGLQTIGDSAFEWNQLTSVTIPSTVISLGNSAFANNRLTEVQLPQGLLTIGDKAFGSAGGSEGNHIISIDIPESVTSLGNLIIDRNSVESTSKPLACHWNGETSRYELNLVDQIPGFNPANYKIPTTWPGYSPFNYVSDLNYDNQTGIYTFSSTNLTKAQLALRVLDIGNSSLQEGGGQDTNRSIVVFPGLNTGYKVTFDLQGGQFVDPSFPEFLIVPDGKPIGQNIGANDVSYPGYHFVGWYKDAECKQSFNIMSDSVRGDMTLYAKWAWDETQDPSVLVSIPSTIKLSEYPAEHMAKGKITLSVIYDKFGPTRNIIINTQRNPLMEKTNHTASFLLDVLKPNGTLYTESDPALMKLNNFGTGNPQSATFTVQTPINHANPFGDYTGNMTYEIALE